MINERTEPEKVEQLYYQWLTNYMKYIQHANQNDTIAEKPIEPKDFIRVKTIEFMKNMYAFLTSIFDKDFVDDVLPDVYEYLLSAAEIIDRYELKGHTDIANMDGYANYVSAFWQRIIEDKDITHILEMLYDNFFRSNNHTRKLIGALILNQMFILLSALFVNKFAYTINPNSQSIVPLAYAQNVLAVTGICMRYDVIILPIPFILIIKIFHQGLKISTMYQSMNINFVADLPHKIVLWLTDISNYSIQI